MKINYWETFEERTYYHIYNRGNNSENLFLSDENYHFFLRKWRRRINPYFDVFAYCLMPNHFHFLVRVKPLVDGVKAVVKKEGTVSAYKLLAEEITYNEFLEDQFKRLFSSYALAFNQQQGRKGSLFQKKFKRVSVKSESKLFHLLAYIHHNPIHHHFCNDYSSWLYSSYLTFSSTSSTILDKEEVLGWFDKVDTEKAKEKFLKFHDDFKLNYKGENPD